MCAIRVIPSVFLSTLGITVAASAAPPVFTGPIPYQSILDSPFFGNGQTCFALETFPNGEPSVSGYQFRSNPEIPGLEEIVPGVGVPPGGFVLQSSINGVIELSFSPPVYEAGFVWTGGAPSGSIISLTVNSGTEAVSNQYDNLPVNDPLNPSDNQFFGVSWETGIEILRITFLPFGGQISNQIDDIQFNSGAQPLDAPDPISPANGELTESSPTFIWLADPCATWYQLWINDSSGIRLRKWYPASQVDGGLGVCQAIPEVGLVNGTATWWVRSWNEEYGSGAWSLASTFLVDSSFGPPTPIGPAGEISTNYPLFSWQSVTEATWYQLWVTDSNGDSVQTWYPADQVGAASGTCRIAPGIFIENGECTWWVRSWNANEGSSAWGPARTFQTGIWGAPIPVDPNEVSGLMPSYTWQPVTSATWYQLWVTDSGGTPITHWFTAEEVGAATGQCSITPSTALSPGACVWWVRPWNSLNGNGPWSEGSSFVAEP